MPPILLSYLFSVLVVTALVLLALHNRKTGWRRREGSPLPALWEAWRKRAGEPAAAPWMPPAFDQQLANLSRALGRAESRPAAASSMAHGRPASPAPSNEVQPITRPTAKNNA